MKILISSIGTRGDMEPLLAIGEMMKEAGHHIICLMPEQFQGLAQEAGFEFRSLGPEFMDMLDSSDGKAALGGSSSGLKKMLAYVRLAKNYGKIHKGLVLTQKEVIEQEQPDLIVHNAKVIYPLIWGINHDSKHVAIIPVPYIHYVKAHPHLPFQKNMGSWLNKFTYWLADMGLLSSVWSSVKWLGLKDQFTKSDLKKAIQNQHSIYTISPSLFARPDYWHDHLQVLGYHERNKESHWTPDQALLDFLDQHEKVLFLSFGSMTNPQPTEKTKLLLSVLQELQIPTLINTASGGLEKPLVYDDQLFHFVSQIPYDWAFPRMYAVVHHGGSGTTHMGLRAGCPTMIIPHIIDQFVWNRLLAEKGVGPLGPKIDQLNEFELKHKLSDLWSNPSYKQKAIELGNAMHQENYRDQLIQTIENLA